MCASYCGSVLRCGAQNIPHEYATLGVRKPDCRPGGSHVTGGLGLYYPYIHFKDDAWVKLSALYWEHMARIVPEGYAVHDSDTVKRLSGELNFVHDLKPGPEKETVGKEFNDFIRKYN